MRDTLAEALSAGSVPYDVGFVWRHGNESSPDDCLTPDKVTEATRRLIHGYMGRYADRSGRVVEKTVGNALRIPYVKEVFPAARFVELIRDGVDVTESSMREWQSPASPKYLAAKLRHFPARLLPTYGRKFVVAQTWGRMGGSHAATWGPRYRGIDGDLASAGLLRVCARQWRASVVGAEQGFQDAAVSPVRVRYEELVRDPRATLARVVEELGEPVDDMLLGSASARIQGGTVGGGRRTLDASALSIVNEEIGDLLEELGYDRNC